MANNSTYQLPVGLLLLDMIGTAFFALGLVKVVANTDILPIHEWLAGTVFENYGIPFIVIGVLLIAPFALHLFARIRAQAEANVRK